jgi:hypothetical protein
VWIFQYSGILWKQKDINTRRSDTHFLSVIFVVFSGIKRWINGSSEKSAIKQEYEDLMKLESLEQQESRLRELRSRIKNLKQEVKLDRRLEEIERHILGTLVDMTKRVKAERSRARRRRKRIERFYPQALQTAESLELLYNDLSQSLRSRNANEQDTGAVRSICGQIISLCESLMTRYDYAFAAKVDPDLIASKLYYEQYSEEQKVLRGPMFWLAVFLQNTRRILDQLGGRHIYNIAALQGKMKEALDAFAELSEELNTRGDSRRGSD